MTDVELLKAIDERFAALGDRLDTRFEQIDGRFQQIDIRFGQMDGRFEQIDDRFARMDARFATLEDRVGQLGIDLAYVRRDMIGALGDGIDQIRRRLDTFQVDVNTRFDRVDGRLIALEATRH